MFEKLRELICQFVEVNEDDINENSKFAEDLGFNSYDFMSLLGEAEDTFDIEIDEADISSLKTVGNMIEYIEGQK